MTQFTLEAKYADFRVFEHKSEDRFIFILMKTKKIQSTSSCLRWSLAMVTLWLHSSFPMASHSAWRPTSSAWKSATLDREDGRWKILCLVTGLCTTQVGEPSVGCKTYFSAIVSALPFGNLTPQIAIPSIIVCRVRLGEPPPKLSVPYQRWTEGKDNGSIYQS